MKHTTSLTNSQLCQAIAEHVHSDRDRRLLRRRFIDGQTYDELSVEFFLSRRQVARIIARARDVLTTEHPPDKRHKKGTSASLRGCPFLFYNGGREEAGKCTTTRRTRSTIRR